MKPRERVVVDDSEKKQENVNGEFMCSVEGWILRKWRNLMNTRKKKKMVVVEAERINTFIPLLFFHPLVFLFRNQATRYISIF